MQSLRRRNFKSHRTSLHTADPAPAASSQGLGEGLGLGDGCGEAGGGVGDSIGFGPSGSAAVSSVADPLDAVVRAVVAGMTSKRNQLSFSPSALRVSHPLTLKVLWEPTIFRPPMATRPETPFRTITSFLSLPNDPKAFVSFVRRLAHVILTLHR
jgi:hypothetical protein